MNSPSYSEFLPNLARAERALEEILGLEGEPHRNFSYHLEEGALSAFWEDHSTINEIAVYHLASPNQVKIEGYSRKQDQFSESHFGVAHVSNIKFPLEAQYGMLSGLEDNDYVFRPDMF